MKGPEPTCDLRLEFSKLEETHYVLRRAAVRDSPHN
jgi:hypothetical protein